MQTAYSECACGSGKKFKFCCLDRKKQSVKSNESLRLVHFEITFEPLPSHGTQFSEEAQREYERANELMSGKRRRFLKGPAQKAIKIYQKLLQQYDDKPELRNNLAMAYKLDDQKDIAERIIAENYQKNPGYLFAKLAFADECLRRGHLDKIPAIFDHVYDLTLIYPNRRVFHISEFLCFSGFMCRYFLEIGKFESAKVLLDAMESVAPDEYQTKVARGGFLTSVAEILADRRGKL